VHTKHSLFLQTGNPDSATLNDNSVLITLGEFRLNLSQLYLHKHTRWASVTWTVLG